ncbi:hypothetical protein JCM19992_17260 [Thermostilla marina]
MERPSVSPSVEQLVRDHAADVYRYAYHLTGNVGDAEDLTQETFARALEKRDQLREPSGARGWLLAIARSLFLKSKRRNRPVLLGETGDGLTDHVEEPPFDGERLSAAIAELPDDFRVVVLMHYFEELPYREIAEALNIPIGTVMSRLSRAKKRLRSLLAPAIETRRGLES